MVEKVYDDEERQAAMLRSLLPYTAVVGQEKLKLALELAYIAPSIGRVLISGHRGTAKSTTVRAFSGMMSDALPLTIPINATEERVVGGWRMDELMQGELKEQPGLLEEAHGRLLYIDEVNLLDDHIVNIILDVTSTGKLVIQREGRDEQLNIALTLVGTMNPEEGGLRPQLQDRFGLMVKVESLADRGQRRQILERVLQFEQDRQLEDEQLPAPFLERERAASLAYRGQIEQARELYKRISLPADLADACIRLAEAFNVQGHRADYILALATKACAARHARLEPLRADLAQVAELVLHHRKPEASQLNNSSWTAADRQRLEDELW